MTQCLSVMRPRGSCFNCTQMYHPLPCREFHQKSQNLERYSVPKYGVPVSTSPFQGRHPGGLVQLCPRDGLRKKGSLCHSQRAGQNSVEHTVFSEHPCSPVHLQPLLPLGSSHTVNLVAKDPSMAMPHRASLVTSPPQEYKRTSVHTKLSKSSIYFTFRSQDIKTNIFTPNRFPDLVVSVLICSNICLKRCLALS